MKKLITLLLLLAMVVSMIPMTVAASTLSPEDIWNILLQELNKDKDPEPNAPVKPDDDDVGEVYLPHNSEDKIVGYGCDTKYHWWQCSCGCKIGMERHVDPKNTTDDTCVCGYHFSDDADLVTLWLDGCLGLKDFRKDVYEYETKAYTYKDVQKIKRIATRTHDSQATVELPEDLTLKEGENKFEIKVTAENQKVTNIYTVTVIKEAKK